MLRLIRYALIAALPLLLLLAACSGDDDDDSGGDTTATATNAIGDPTETEDAGEPTGTDDSGDDDGAGVCSIMALISSKVTSPCALRPLMKKVGVPITPNCRPRCFTSFKPSIMV